jgi:hypothetical protein
MVLAFSFTKKCQFTTKLTETLFLICEDHISD